MPVASYCAPDEATKRTGIFLDTKTTGREFDTDNIT